MKVTKENSKELRLQAMAEAKVTMPATKEDAIKQMLYIAWGEWQPDYTGWLNWSNNLYAADATISAIGDTPQKFRDYQASMKDQRDRCAMEMGPIQRMIVEDNVAALVYHMFLTPKGMENAPTFSMLVTEYNTVEEVDGKLTVTHLELYTDGGNLGSMGH